MADFEIKSGNTAPALVSTLYDGPNPLNLSGATVAMRMRSVSGGTLVVNAPASIVGDPTLGEVSYQWQPADTANVGDFEVEWVVTFLGGQVQTFPTEGYTTVTINPSLITETLDLPDLPDGCWPVDHGCCSEFDNYSATIRARADALAVQTLRMLTGYSVGGCPVTLRPCSESCVSGAMGWYWNGGTFTPYVNTLGQWVNGCGCQTSCACGPLSTVRLGGVGTVLAVKVDGVTLPATAYRVDNGMNLVRLDGGTWPTWVHRTPQTTPSPSRCGTALRSTRSGPTPPVVSPASSPRRAPAASARCPRTSPPSPVRASRCR
jgi:hypothetical protein